ncbi:MAG: hypothetical protein WCI18_15405 [Pseudomonadota bacterium]
MRTWNLVSAIYVISLVSSLKAYSAGVESSLKGLFSEGKALTNGTVEADGSRLMSSAPRFSIVPPAGWSVTYSNEGLGPTLVMQEAAPKMVAGSLAPIFRRNITLAIIQEASPIDSLREKSFRDQLANTYGKNALTKDFQVIETKFADWKSSKDAILAYSSWMAGDIQMMQMNVLMSSNNQQYMLTYTDMASRFLPESAEMASAWQSIMSLDLSDAAPSRFTKPLAMGSLVAVIAGLLVMFKVARRRRFSGLYDDVDTGEESLSSLALSEAEVSMSEDVHKNKKAKKQIKTTPEFDPISFETSEAASELPMKKESKAKEYSSFDLSADNEKEQVKVSQKSSIQKAAKDKSDPSIKEDFSMAGDDTSWALNVSNQ